MEIGLIYFPIIFNDESSWPDSATRGRRTNLNDDAILSVSRQLQHDTATPLLG